MNTDTELLRDLLHCAGAILFAFLMLYGAGMTLLGVWLCWYEYVTYNIVWRGALLILGGSVLFWFSARAFLNVLVQLNLIHAFP